MRCSLIVWQPHLHGLQPLPFCRSSHMFQAQGLQRLASLRHQVHGSRTGGLTHSCQRVARGSQGDCGSVRRRNLQQAKQHAQRVVQDAITMKPDLFHNPTIKQLLKMRVSVQG